MVKQISLLGSTGSIGTQSLDVIRAQGYGVFALAAHSSVEKIEAQIAEFHPRYVTMVDPAAAARLRVDLAGMADAPKVLEGPEGLVELAKMDGPDVVLNAVVGIAGLGATLAAIESGHDVALANKESLVTGGHLVTEAVKRHGVKLLPVDSEHSAIFQCLQARADNPVRRLHLTASGGALRDWPKEKMAAATVRDVLAHPTWRMGGKITVDCATMVNKGLEVIEARWLFDMPPERINVVVHPQSVIHSMIEFEDGAVLAQLGRPDMRGPIGYAMGYPERLPYGAEPLDFAALSKLTFAAPDMERFPGLALARAALEEGGSAPVILNGANEAAVAAFLEERIPFGRIAEIIAETMNACPRFAIDEIGDVHAADAQARAVAAEIIGRTSL